MFLSKEKINEYEGKGYLFRGVKEYIIDDVSKEDAGWFDDIVYSANEFCGEVESYDFNIENCNRYFESKRLPYIAKSDENGNWFVSFGVNCCYSFNDVLQFNACPNAEKIVVFEGTILGTNLGDDGIVAKINNVIGVFENWD